MKSLYLFDILFCLPQILCFSFRFGWLCSKKDYLFSWVNCLLKIFFLVHCLNSPESTILTEPRFFAKLLYQKPLATIGSTVPCLIPTGRLVSFLLSLPSAQGNSRENPASISGSFSMKPQTQDDSLKPPMSGLINGRSLSFRDSNSALGLVRSGSILGPQIGLWLRDTRGCKFGMGGSSSYSGPKRLLLFYLSHFRNSAPHS